MSEPRWNCTLEELTLIDTINHNMLTILNKAPNMDMLLLRDLKNALLAYANILAKVIETNHAAKKLAEELVNEQNQEN